MNKGLCVLAILAVTSAAMVDGVAAKQVSYEINGQRYSYSTNNIEQTKQARRRIAAAEAAEAARAKVETERRGNPLRAIFGSTADREAEQAEARLKAELAGQAAPVPVPATPKAEPAPRTVKAVRPASVPDRAAEPPSRETKPRTVVRRDPAPSDERRATPPQAAVAKPVAITGPSASQEAGPAGVRSVSFDAATGIKTTFMADGSVQEEPFDPGALPASDRDKVAKQSRPPSAGPAAPSGAPEETTGSTQLPPAKASVDAWSPFASGSPRR